MTDTKRRAFLHKKPEEERIEQLKFELQIPPWENLSKELDKLPEFNRALLLGRYGVLGKDPMTAKDLCEKYSLSPRLLRSTIQESIKLLLKLRNMEKIIDGHSVQMRDKQQRLDEAMTCLRQLNSEGQRRSLLNSERQALLKARGAIDNVLREDFRLPAS